MVAGKEKINNIKGGELPVNQEDGNRVRARNSKIIRTSIIGILANVLLAGFKTVIGLMSHSIAIVMDAVNNLSDAASSVITIIGTKLAGKEADKKHPFGYGRIEYLSAMVISLLVLYAGITSFVESAKKLFIRRCRSIQQQPWLSLQWVWSLKFCLADM